MTSFSDILTILGAVVGVGLLLIMALAPLLTDRHWPDSDRPVAPVAPAVPVDRRLRPVPSVALPAEVPAGLLPRQRGARGLVPGRTSVRT